MMSRLRIVLPAAIVFCAVLAGSLPIRGNVKYNKQEKRPCVTCHVSIKTKDLNDVGKCFKKNQSLAGCEKK